MKKRICSIGLLLAVLGVMLAVCRQTDGFVSGKSQGSDYRVDRQETEDGADKQKTADEPQNQEESENVKSLEVEKDGNYWMLKMQSEATIDYGRRTVPARYSNEVINIEYTEDLSLLECADETDHWYAYLDGKVYYRQYHEDSFEESGLWANYAPVPGTEKEMVCIDQSGVKTELFKDEGYGEFYLIGGRFYMKEVGNLYSVNMAGRDRIDYGPGEIMAVDEAGHMIVLGLYDEESGTDFCVLHCDTGVCKSLSSQGAVRDEAGSPLLFCAYQDGCVYLQKINSTAKTTELYAVSMEGEWEKIIVLAPEAEHYYTDYIVHMEVCGDRLFFAYGGYDGSEHHYQGGRITTVKKDGSDYRSVRGMYDEADYFYLCRNAERTLVFYPNRHIVELGVDDYERYNVTAWDIDTGIMYPVEMPFAAVYADDLYIDFIDKANNVRALPDMNGRIVKVVEHLDDFIDVLPGETDGDSLQPRFSYLYYKDGYLYFEAEYSVWSKEDCIGWRDGYRRVQTQQYRLKLGGNETRKAELLYSY